MSEIKVPERNRAVKKLLEETYLLRAHDAKEPLCPGVKISVRAGTGTAYHWIMIEFNKRVPLPAGMMHNRVEEAIEDLIISAGIHISTFNSDGDYTGKCISIRMPHQESR
jgi:hypothetical protein